MPRFVSVVLRGAKNEYLNPHRSTLCGLCSAHYSGWSKIRHPNLIARRENGWAIAEHNWSMHSFALGNGFIALGLAVAYWNWSASIQVHFLGAAFMVGFPLLFAIYDVKNCFDGLFYRVRWNDHLVEVNNPFFGVRRIAWEDVESFLMRGRAVKYLLRAKDGRTLSVYINMDGAEAFRAFAWAKLTLDGKPVSHISQIHTILANGPDHYGLFGIGRKFVPFSPWGFYNKTIDPIENHPRLYIMRQFTWWRGQLKHWRD
jgi:hypothetical protein